MGTGTFEYYYLIETTASKKLHAILHVVPVLRTHFEVLSVMVREKPKTKIFLFPPFFCNEARPLRSCCCYRIIAVFLRLPITTLAMYRYTAFSQCHQCHGPAAAHFKKQHRQEVATKFFVIEENLIAMSAPIISTDKKANPVDSVDIGENAPSLLIPTEKKVRNERPSDDEAATLHLKKQCIRNPKNGDDEAPAKTTGLKDIPAGLVLYKIIPFLDASTIKNIMVNDEAFSRHYRLSDSYCGHHGKRLSLEGETLENVLKKIKKDGKDPDYFQEKLADRIEYHDPILDSDDEFCDIIDHDPEYTPYLSMMKECDAATKTRMPRVWPKQDADVVRRVNTTSSSTKFFNAIYVIRMAVLGVVTVDFTAIVVPSISATTVVLPELEDTATTAEIIVRNVTLLFLLAQTAAK